MEKLICAGWIWDGIEKEPHKDYAICVKEGKIKAMGPSEELKKQFPNAELTEKSQWLILPGYIDGHDHGRGVSPFWFGAEDGCLETWIPRLGEASVPPYEAALYDGMQLASSGVTTVVHCHNTQNITRIAQELIDTVKGYLDAGIRVAICPPYIDQNSLIYSRREEFIHSLPKQLKHEFEQMICDKPLSLDEYFALVEELKTLLRPQIDAGMTEIQLHPVGGQWCSDEALLGIKEYACSRNMRIHMHLLETKYQMFYARETWGKSMIVHFEEIGFLGPWLTCAHAVWMSEEDLDIIARRGVALVTNPSSNLRLRSGTMALGKILNSGICCGIGLDGCGYDDDQDYGRELRTALYNNFQSGVHGEIAHETILKAAYQGGRQAVGENLSDGCLRPGGKADFICLDYRKLTFPYADTRLTIPQLVVQKGCRQMVSAVYCAGSQILKSKEEIIHAGEKMSEAILQNKTKDNKTVSNELIQAISDFYGDWERREYDNENSSDLTNSGACRL